jgi:mono/diheme cytochrome c family protein
MLAVSMTTSSMLPRVLALACGFATVTLQATPVPAWAQVPLEQGQSVLAGSRVFSTRGCSECHAVNGLGGDLGPDLAKSERPQSFFGFAAAMWNHLPDMVSQMRAMGIDRPRLTPWETGDLIAFLVWLDYFDPPGDTASGRELFSEKSCIVCHQVAGVGGVVGPSLDFLNQYGSPVQIATALWNHGPSMSAAMREHGIRRPTFSGSELADLVAFLKSATSGLPEGAMYVLPGRAEEGRRLFEERSCTECHGIHGTGGELGPDLSQLAGRHSLLDFAAAMWNKAPAMTAAMREAGVDVPQLRAGEMADLLAYLHLVQSSAERGESDRGPRLLSDKGCLVCHSVAGRGGDTAGDLTQARGLTSQAGVIAALWNHVLISDEPGRSVASWPTFTPEEMADLAAYLQTIGRAR